MTSLKRIPLFLVLAFVSTQPITTVHAEPLAFYDGESRDAESKTPSSGNSFFKLVLANLTAVGIFVIGRNMYRDYQKFCIRQALKNPVTAAKYAVQNPGVLRDIVMDQLATETTPQNFLENLRGWLTEKKDSWTNHDWEKQRDAWLNALKNDGQPAH